MRYNANVSAIPAFKAHVSQWEIRLIDPETNKKHHHTDFSGLVYHRAAAQDGTRPDFYLCLRAALESEALVLASNNEEFWFYSKMAKQGWWGTYTTHAEQLGERTPMNPNVMLACIGFQPLPTDRRREPYPLYKIEPEHNIIEYVITGETGLQLRREIIIDRRSDLPAAINDYNEHGLPVRQTILGDYTPLGEAMLPGTVKITQASDGSFLRLKLHRFKIDKTPHSEKRDRLYQRPEHVPGLKNYENIDTRLHYDQDDLHD